MLENWSERRSLRTVVVLLYSLNRSWTFLSVAIFFQEFSHYSMRASVSPTSVAAFLPSAAVRMMAP